MSKKNGLITLAALSLLITLTTCDLFNAKPENDLFQQIDNSVEYANAATINARIGIIPGTVSGSTGDAPAEKVGYSFTVQATANSGYQFIGWIVMRNADWDARGTMNTADSSL